MKAATDLKIDLCRDHQVFTALAGWMAASDPWITLGMNAEKCLLAFEGDFREVFILRNEVDILGFVILQIKGSFKGYIQTLFIHPDHHRKGFGKRLLQFSEDHIRKISPNIFICVSAFNKGAIKLYEEAGFTYVGTLTDFVRTGYNELLYRKSFGDLLNFNPRHT